MSDLLAFSTLGCSGEPLDEVARLAARHGCAGVELRCFAGEPIGVPGPGDAATLPADRGTVAALHDAGIQVLSLASYVYIAESDPDLVAATLRHVDLAAALGAPYLRVFGHRSGEPGHRAAAVRTLERVADRIAGSGVRVLLETHDAFRTGRQVAQVLAEVGSPHLGAVWDVVNPWRTGEDVATTLEALRPWLGYVQLKDVASPEDLRPVLPGAGTVPLREVLDALRADAYRGWLSLEWERAWFPDVAPLDRALTEFTGVVTGSR